MSGFLLDTNVISELVRPRPEPRVWNWVTNTDNDLLYLSVLTIGEIRKGTVAAREPLRRAMLESWLDSELLEWFEGRILPVDRAVADRWGRITGKVLATGAKTTVPVIDGLLAATAIQHDLTFVTRDVQGVVATGVALFNPWEH